MESRAKALLFLSCSPALPETGGKRRRGKPHQGEQPRRVTLQAFGSGRAGASFTLAEENLENGKWRSENESEIGFNLNIIHFIKKAIPPPNIYPSPGEKVSGRCLQIFLSYAGDPGIPSS
jgi:hypothetical protein